MKTFRFTVICATCERVIGTHSLTLDETTVNVPDAINEKAKSILAQNGHAGDRGVVMMEVHTGLKAGEVRK